MARFTNIGMPRKTFVQSSAEEAGGRGVATGANAGADEAGPSGGEKRKGAWGRDPSIAKRAKLAADRTEVRRLKRADNRTTATTCFACRGIGHAARDCPNILLAASGENGSAAMLEADSMAERQAEALAAGDEGDGAAKESGKLAKKGKKGKGKNKEVTGGQVTGGRCYRCNSSDHSLHKCPKPVDKANPTPYATCFVCLGTGHLSAACPQNPRGVYVNGGSCKVCGSVAHRAKDCPVEREKMRAEAAAMPRPGDVVHAATHAPGADEDDFMVVRREPRGSGSRPQHERAKNGMRAPAKLPGDEGAYEAPAPVPAAAPKKKKKVVTF